MPRQRLAFRLAAASALLAAACGGGSSSSPSAPSPPASGAATITITASGVSPGEVTISLGQRVTFVNNDSRSHHMASDPHPEHADCPEINQVGFLRPGERRETGNFVTARTCGFHDHDLPAVQSLRGRIVIR